MALKVCTYVYQDFVSMQIRTVNSNLISITILLILIYCFVKDFEVIGLITVAFIDVKVAIKCLNLG